MTQEMTPLSLGDTRQIKRSSLFVRFLKRPLGSIPLAVVVLLILVAFFANLLAPYDPNQVFYEIVKAPPSGDHLLGGDLVGRDVLSRLLIGTQSTLWGALVAIVVSVVIGVPFGVASGYFGGRFDRIATWISDALQSIPGMIILLIVAAGTGNNFTILMATVGVFMTPGYYRLTRSTTMAVRNEPYIDAAKVAGLSNTRIMAKHVITGVWAPIIIQTSLTAGLAMAMQAGLQFLGIGAADTPAWGAMMNDGFHNMLISPLLLLWPSLALGIAIAAFAIGGSTLADVIDPKSDQQSRRRRKKRAAAPLTDTTGSMAYIPEDTALQIENLRVSYDVGDDEKEVVHGINLDIAPREVLGIVGESGSGKSQTVFSVLDLLPTGGRYTADAIWIGGRDVTSLSHRGRQKLLGSEVGYIPQEPMTNLDPCYTIGYQLMEPLRSVHGLSKKDARQRAWDVLARVGIHDPKRVMGSYPHELSGGMAQRVLIAGAISARPSVLVADEPTTALDVTVQAEVLELLRELQAEYGMALVMVTHNFGVVADICDRVVVMRSGQIEEIGTVENIFAHPQTEYTRTLISASLDGAAARHELDTQLDESEKVSAR